jgi:hypothetical protein
MAGAVGLFSVECVDRGRLLVLVHLSTREDDEKLTVCVSDACWMQHTAHEMR